VRPTWHASGIKVFTGPLGTGFKIRPQVHVRGLGCYMHACGLLRCSKVGGASCTHCCDRLLRTTWMCCTSTLHFFHTTTRKHKVSVSRRPGELHRVQAGLAVLLEEDPLGLSTWGGLANLRFLATHHLGDVAVHVDGGVAR